MVVNKKTRVQQKKGGGNTETTLIVGFRCPVELWDWVKHEAIRQRTSRQAICIEALTEYKDRRKAA